MTDYRIGPYEDIEKVRRILKDEMEGEIRFVPYEDKHMQARRNYTVNDLYEEDEIKDTN